ncbi:MAG: ECF transporter S component, partial [Butyricicoccus pullicaecorum]|nr:ECF transporter S component [Butyricicoccus pullicaecorum]
MKLTYVAVFSAIATVLMYFEFPIPLMPPFLKIDLSGAVILIGAFIFGIGPAITMAAIKDLIHVTQTQTAGSGELQDFILTCTLIILAVSIYRLHRSKKGALIGCAVGSVAMSIMAMITNKLIILPFYIKGMGMNLDMIFDMCK